MSSNHCPDKKELLAWLQDLSEEPDPGFTSHIDGCVACQRVLEEHCLDQERQVSDPSGSDLLDDLRCPPPDCDFERETDCERAAFLAEAMMNPPGTHEESSRSPDLLMRPEPTRLGQYQILERLGQGGMGVVYKAIHPKLDRVVAIKVLTSERMQNPDAVARFEREMKAVARLSHPNIVTAHDADEAEGWHFLVLEHVEGTDLKSLVRRAGPIPADQAINYVLQAARGLQCAHEQGIIHRDVKPSNLILDQSGTVKVLDLGLARLEALDTGVEERSDLTGSGVLMGTVDYMAPEQADNCRNADARSDVYSLGCTLHYLLTGQPLFTGGSILQRAQAHSQRAIPSLRACCPDVSNRQAEAFAKMVAKNPDDRFQSMVEVIHALTAEAHPSGSSATTRSIALPSRRSSPLQEDQPARPKRSLWWIAALVVILGILGLVLPGLLRQPRDSVAKRSSPKQEKVTSPNGRQIPEADPSQGDPPTEDNVNGTSRLTVTLGSKESEEGIAITTDFQGNTYVGGSFSDTVDFDPGSGVANLTSKGKLDGFLWKLAPNGKRLWAKAFGGPEADAVEGVAVGTDGSVYVTGYFSDRADFHSDPGRQQLVGRGSTDIFVAKLSAEGAVLWVKQMGGPENHEGGKAITVDHDGNVYTTGTFRGIADLDPGPAVYELTSLRNNNAFVSKLSSKGDLVWARQLGGKEGAAGIDLALDSHGNVCILGTFNDVGDFDPGKGVYPLTSHGAADLFVSKLNSRGEFVWAKQMGGTGYDLAGGLTLDDLDNLYLTGGFADRADFGPGPGDRFLTSKGFTDIFALKMSPKGERLWVRQMPGPGYNSGMDIAVDRLRNTYLTGFFEGTVDFDPGEPVRNLSAQDKDIFMVRLNNKGNLVWAHRLGGLGYDRGHSLAVDNRSRLHVTGIFSRLVDFPSGERLKTFASNGGSDVFVLRH